MRVHDARPDRVFAVPSAAACRCGSTPAPGLGDLGAPEANSTHPGRV